MLKVLTEGDHFAHPHALEFIFEKGEHQGERYRGSVAVCDNPLCSCGEATFVLESSDDRSVRKYSFRLDLMAEKIAKGRSYTLSAADRNFVQSFVRELDAAQWGELRVYFYSYKVGIIENCDIEKLEPQFPMARIEAGNTMMRWMEIFPYADRILAEDGAVQYVFDDQYCVNPNCPCKEAMMSIVPIRDGMAANRGDPLAIVYHYTKGTWETVHLPSDGSISAETVVEKLRQARPDIARTLKERHRKLRRLYANYRRKQGKSAEVRMEKKRALSANIRGLGAEGTRRQKPGRNDPCPCGSGKKYKMCCGR